MRRARPKLAGNDWIAPVQRLLPDGRFCDVSSGPTAGAPTAPPVGPDFLEPMSKPPRNELTSVIPRIEMIARPHLTIKTCTVYRAMRYGEKLSAAPLRRNQFDCRCGSCARDNIRKIRRDPFFLIRSFLRRSKTRKTHRLRHTDMYSAALLLSSINLDCICGRVSIHAKITEGLCP